jgi:hypothetical protein
MLCLYEYNYSTIKDISLSLNPKFLAFGIMITLSSLMKQRKENINNVTVPVYPTRYVGFEVLTAEEYIFWDITPCSPLKLNRYFGAMCHLHLEGRISQARASMKAGNKPSHLLSRWHFAHLILP